MRALRFLLFCLIFPAIAFAVPGPGIPNVAYPPGKVGDMISDDNGYQETTAVGTAPPGVVCSDIGRTALIGFHEGYLFAGFEAPGSRSGSRAGQCVINFSDPANPSIFQWFDNGNQGQNAHGLSKKGGKIHIGRGYRVRPDGSIYQDGYGFRDFGGGDRGGMYAGWHATFKWSYGAVSGLHYLSEQENGRNRIQHAAIDVGGQTGILGSYPYILGNLLIFASDQSQRGVAAYDISDPGNPRLLDFLNGGIGIGGYWVEIWKHYLIFPRRTRSASDPSKPGVVFIVDFQDPTDLKYVAEIPINGSPMYGQMQDHYLFVDNTKIDLSPLDSGQPPQVVLEFGDSALRVDQSQFLLPVGNLLFTGGIQGGDNKWQGVTAWVHQAEPDTRCPDIAYHWPSDGEREFPATAPLSIMIHETIETANLELGRTFIVREVGNPTPLDGDWVFPMFDVLSFNPYGNFKPGTQYEVLFTEDAFTDAVGNPICDSTGPGDGIAYRFTFTTSDGSNPYPQVNSFRLNQNSPLTVGDTATFSFSGSDNNNLEYRLDFGDGDELTRKRTAWQDVSQTFSATESHTYTKAGNFRVILQVRERGSLTRLSSQVLNLVVAEPPPSSPPVNSSEMLLDQTNRALWVVNPDNNSVSKINADTNLLESEVEVGDHPAGIAVDGSGRPWVPCRDSDDIFVLSPSGAIVKRLRVDYGSRPVSVLFTPDKSRGFVALEGVNRVVELDMDSLSLKGLLASQPGVNFEFYDRLSGDLQGVNSDQDVRPAMVDRRFYGTYESLGDSLRSQFEDLYPTTRPTSLRGVSASYAMVFRGQILVPTSGDYSLYLVSGSVQQNLSFELEGAEKLYASNASREASTTVNLPAGLHRFKLVHYKVSGGGGSRDIRVEWEGPGIARQRIPDSSIFPIQEQRKPKALASDGSTLFVAQFISDDNGGKIARYNLESNSWEKPIFIYADEKTRDSGAEARGVPNYILSVVLSPDAGTIWYGGKKDNIFTNAPTFETTVRAAIGPMSTSTGRPLFDSFNRPLAIDVDNHSLPSHLVYDPTGTKLFATMLANNELLVLDVNTRKEIDRVQVGVSPTAVTIDPATKKIFVKNFLDRSVTILDGVELIDRGLRNLSSSRIATVLTVSRESLPPQILLGKKLFYSARDLDDHQANPARMSLDGYLSCASCHLDGDSDGRTVKRASLGEGFRNTTSLRGTSGTAHGNVHWSANFDEIQDFELDMVGVFGGRGFLENDGGPNPSLGAPNGGRNADLDALAAYVSSLQKSTVPRSPYRQSGGAPTREAQQGKAIFESAGCGGCHLPGGDYQDSQLGATPRLHNVGTLKSTSGSRLGEALTGIDTPTLLGIHATAPYLHDGSAGTLEAVFEQYNPAAPDGSSGRAHDLRGLTSANRQLLYRYLLELDGSDDGSQFPSSPENLRLR